MCFPRKPYLGHYNASRREWAEAYRSARIKSSLGSKPDAAYPGIAWKAELVVSERNQIDPLTMPGNNRLAAARLIYEVLSEQ